MVPSKWYTRPTWLIFSNALIFCFVNIVLQKLPDKKLQKCSLLQNCKKLGEIFCQLGTQIFGWSILKELGVRRKMHFHGLRDLLATKKCCLNDTSRCKSFGAIFTLKWKSLKAKIPEAKEMRKEKGGFSELHC